MIRPDAFLSDLSAVVRQCCKININENMSTVIRTGKLPEQAISIGYARNGAYTDCYYIDISRKVTFEEYIESFYTTSLFKVERIILWWFARKPSSDEDAKQLSKGQSKRFAAWTVEHRLSNQILLCDYTNKTRSWLMVEYQDNTQAFVTRLYFGSVVIPKSVSNLGQTSFGLLFHLLSRFHHIYSRALLKAAFVKLEKKNEFTGKTYREY